MRIRSKFIVLFLLLSLAPLTLIDAIAYRNGRQAIEEHLGQLFELRANRVVEMLDREMRALQRGAQAWTGLELMQDVLTDDIDGRISSFLIEQARRHETLTRALVVNPAGLVAAASRPEWVGRVLPEAAAAGEALDVDVCSDDPTVPDATPTATVSCAFQIRALFNEEKILGTLLVSWDLGELFRRTPSARSLDSAPGDQLLLRRDGVVVSAPDSKRDWVFRLNLAASGSRAAALAAAARSGFLVERLAGRDHLIGYGHSTGTLGWSVLVAQDVAAAFAPVYQLRNFAFGVGAAVALSVVGLSVMLGRRAARPLLELAEAAQRVAGGDLEVQVAARSRDELGSLSDSFNRMIQDLKRQRTQLVDKQYLDSIITSMIDGLLVVDPQGVVVKANRALLEMLEVGEDAILGRRAGALFAEGDAAFHETLLEPALAGGAVREVELRLQRGRGEPIPASVSAGAIPSREGGIEAVVCIATDITRRKHTEQALVGAREEAEAAAQAKAQFLATISHEVRTPLNGIIGMMDVLFGTPLTTEQRGFAETARRSGDALLAVVNDILDFSKIDAGRLELESIDFDLRACLEAVGDVLALRAHEKGIELVVQVEPGLPERVHGDPARLRQVLLNLGSNAIKFTPRGEVVIRCGPETGDAARVLFSVIDTGIGIPPDRLERLFKPFAQLDASTTRRYGGTGLGLAISREIVQLMKGEIGVESEPGRGSTFHFTAELPAGAAADAAPRIRPAALPNIRVLIVDDNATNRQVLREMLKAWGWTFAEAADAWEALERLKTSASSGRGFDLALIDFQMPEMDGGQLAAEIKKDPRLAGIPLVLVTSVPQHGDAARMMNMGFDAYLTKPIKQSVLHEAVVAVMGARAVPGLARPQLALVTAHTVSEASRHRRRILVVDDRASSREVASQALEQAGYPCDVAENGVEALRALQNNAYDLVFIDCQMPEMDGYEATRRIRLAEAGRPHTPIVAMTGEVLAGIRQRCLTAGMDDAISKPVRAEDFHRMLQRYLRTAPEAPDASQGERAARPLPVVADPAASEDAGLAPEPSPSDPTGRRE